MNKQLQEAFFEALAQSLKEDLGKEGDITVQALGLGGVRAQAKLRAKAAGVLAGFNALVGLDDFCQNYQGLQKYSGQAITFRFLARDGKKVEAGEILADLEGPADWLLILERSLLNLLAHLSGIASITARFVEEIRDTKTQICDTRKTMPGYRLLEKYAVQCGGGKNHRMGLYDQAMLKENHLALIRKNLAEGVEEVRAFLGEKKRITCEVENLEELKQALESSADCILLDNFTLEMLEQALALRKEGAKEAVIFEASGGIGLKDLRARALLGVERISIGALTHSAPALDLSLAITPLEH